MKKELTESIKKLKARKGFAVMSKEARTRIARLGGKATSKDRRFMAAIGRLGGMNSHKGNGK